MIQEHVHKVAYLDDKICNTHARKSMQTLKTWNHRVYRVD